MAAQITPERLTAQIACEAIINHEDDGYTLADMAAVFEVASRAGVAAFYLGMLADLIGTHVRLARESMGA